MTTFGKYIEQAREEARDDGSAAVEAQHLLLAIAAGPDAATRQILAAGGLDHRALRDALDREFEHSLAAAGYPPPRLTSRNRAKPPHGRRAWERRPDSPLNGALPRRPASKICSRPTC
jgi:ATP-dependent Clp protease ATP-binding subunit ClpA